MKTNTGEKEKHHCYACGAVAHHQVNPPDGDLWLCEYHIAFDRAPRPLALGSAESPVTVDQLVGWLNSNCVDMARRGQHEPAKDTAVLSGRIEAALRAYRDDPELL